MEKRLLIVEEAAEYLGVRKSTIYSWAWRKKIPTVKMGRRLLFDRENLDQMMEERGGRDRRTKKTELTLLDHVYNYSRNLIAAHRHLLRFGHNLSTQDLVQLTSVVYSETSSGRPVRPPTEFISAVQRVVSEKEWTQLYRLLEKWNEESEGETRFCEDELEYLTMGLLWETLLIMECKRQSS